MAIGVRTWAEFVAAYQSPADTVIELLADIDGNSAPMTSSITKPSAKTINGNGHAIYNVSTGSVVNENLFRGAYTLTFNNCKLYNWYRIENYPFFWSSDTYRTVFNDCEIVGRCAAHISERATLNRCSYSWSGIKDPTKGKICTAYNTWLHIDAQLTSVSTSNAFWGTLNNSYLEGNITYTSATFTQKFFDTLVNSVINLTTTGANSTWPTGTLSVYNSTKAPNFVDAGGAIGVTDNQMKDAEYLYSVGFDIVI